MEKLVLLSLIFATMIVPQRIASIEPRATGYKKLKMWVFVYCGIYVLLVTYVYPRFI